MPRPSSLLAIVAASGFILAYGALGAWVLRSAPSHGGLDAQAYIAEVLVRPGRPIDPLPIVRVPETVELAMPRDPFTPIR